MIHIQPNIWLILLIIFTTAASAITPTVQFERLTINHGMSHNNVLSILQDHKGYLWLGTAEGLNRFDGYQFKTFHHIPNQPLSISNNWVKTLFEDQQGRLWIGTNAGGLNRFDPASEQFTRFEHDKSNPNSLSDNSVWAISQDHNNQLWIGTFNGGLNRLDIASGQITRFMHNPNDPNSIASNRVLAAYQDQQQQLWIGTETGLERYDHNTEQFIHYQHDPKDPKSITPGPVYALLQDHSGMLWIATNYGLNRFDQYRQQFQRFVHDNSSNSLSHNDTNSLFEDQNNNLWIGTFGGGLNKLDPKRQTFTHHTHQSADPNSLSSNTIFSINGDNQGNIWIGTKASGLSQLIIQRQQFNHFRHQANNGNSLSHNDVTALFIDAQQRLWLGTGNGLNQYIAPTSKTQQRFEFYQRPSSPNSSNNYYNVYAIAQDPQGILWLGTESGLYLFDPDQKHFINNPIDSPLFDIPIFSIYRDHDQSFLLGTWGQGILKWSPEQNEIQQLKHSPIMPGTLSNNTIYCFYRDSFGELWVGTEHGLNRLDPATGQFKAYFKDQNQPHSISHNTVTTIFEDSNKQLWFGSGNGVNRFNREQDNFTHYRQQTGITSSVIHSIIEDDLGDLWFATNHGLLQFNPKTEIFNHFDASHGLQSNGFNSRAAFKSHQGELFFGGINGFNRFYPENIKKDNFIPQIVFTDLLLANQSVAVQSNTNDETYSIPNTIDTLEQLFLDHKQNLISIEFASLNFSSPMQSKYAYKLQGWNNEWIYTDAKHRRATYTNIPAGDYTFKVKAVNRDGFWSQQEKTLKISISPAPWATWWAYSLYGLVLSLLLLKLLSLQRLKLKNQDRKLKRQKQKIADQQALNDKLQQIDQLKDEFLANTSHELRTPLNGIIGLAESLIDGVSGPQSDSGKANLAMIVASGKRLSNLVNDVLDFSKLKNHTLTIIKRPVDLHSLLEIVLTLSKPLVQDKNIRLINDIPKDFVYAHADEDRVQQIFYNLVGNAIKFTHNGYVKISAKVSQQQISIDVSDTGIGIGQSQQEAIFESFSQVHGHSERQYSGTGLGLSLCRQLVALHNGVITVHSKVGKGATFSFTLPIASKSSVDQNPPSTNSRTISQLSPIQSAVNVMPAPKLKAEGQFKILLVDDEPVNRQVLINHLSLQNYQLIEASNGIDALNIIKAQGDFDLVLLDIMMPQMSGYEVCKRLRESYPMSDLPIVFLTAKNQVSDMVESFNIGANDYLCKPFNKQELLARVSTHLKFLDIHRNLESKVDERTSELEQKNTEIIQTQQQLIQAEKMASLGVLTAGIAHEINNPTNFVYISVQTLGLNLKDFQSFLYDLIGDSDDQQIRQEFETRFNPLYQHLQTITDGTERIQLIVDDLKAFTQLDAAELKTVVITELLQSTINLVNSQFEQITHFEQRFEQHPQLECYPAQLNQVFMNLILNACEAIKVRQQTHPGKGTIKIHCKTKEKASQTWVEIGFNDDGCGMSQATQNKMFEPFYTTKDIGEGTGLGLSIAYGIIKKHGGTLSVESEQNRYSTMLIELPLTL